MAIFLEYAGRSGGVSVAMKRPCCSAATKIANEPTTTKAMPKPAESKDEARVWVAELAMTISEQRGRSAQQQSQWQ